MYFLRSSQDPHLIGYFPEKISFEIIMKYLDTMEAKRYRSLRRGTPHEREGRGGGGSVAAHYEIFLPNTNNSNVLICY